VPEAHSFTFCLMAIAVIEAEEPDSGEGAHSGSEVSGCLLASLCKDHCP